jgi:hypothetical protein
VAEVSAEVSAAVVLAVLEGEGVSVAAVQPVEDLVAAAAAIR